MKELTIVRHGKSEWDNSSISDVDRHLTEQGIKNAYTIAQRLLSKNIIPDLILTSTANRAMHTACIFSRVLKVSSLQITIDCNMYLTSPKTIVDIVNRIPDTVNSAMLFGHNPTFTELANMFLKNPIHNMPTTGMAWFQFDITSWNDFYKSQPVDSFFDSPKNN